MTKKSLVISTICETVETLTLFYTDYGNITSIFRKLNIQHLGKETCRKDKVAISIQEFNIHTLKLSQPQS